MTVAKAYRDLAEAGFVEGRAGGGTHVRAPNGAGSRRARGSEPAAAGPLLSERLYLLRIPTAPRSLKAACNP
jgi:DNA-binding FadR family transcriptional regulator